ncbi:MAG: hypothetical protein KTR26_01135 [Flammeovirgaceae bacterium]|nr:hypothetical protein [Flammeovirgaceae bacterium]
MGVILFHFHGGVYPKKANSNIMDVDTEETKATFKIGENEVDRFRIDNTGKMPWRAQNTQMTITIKNDKIKSAKILDEAGYEEKVIPVTSIEGGFSIILPKDAMYVIVDTKKDQVLA